MSLAVEVIALACPVGHSVAAATAALRSGIAAFGELPYRDAKGTHLVGAQIAALPPDLRGAERLHAMCALMLEDLPDAIANNLPWDDMPLVLCTRDDEMPGARPDKVLRNLAFPRGARFEGRRAVRICGGAPSALQALVLAERFLAKNKSSACLLLAVDSLIDARPMHWLERTERLKTSERTDGIIPGEAACLAVVTRQPRSPSAIVIRGYGEAEEPATVLNEEPFRADGMTAALRAALDGAGLALHEVDFRISDLAGESYAFEEMALTQTRLMRQIRPSQPLWHAADCIGDTGAAAGLIQMAWAGQAFARGYAPGPVAALHCASPFGARAAAIVSGAGGGHA